MARAKKIQVMRKKLIAKKQTAWDRMRVGFSRIMPHFKKERKFVLSPHAKGRGIGQDVRRQTINIADLAEVEE